MYVASTLEDDTNILEYKSEILVYKAGIGQKLVGKNLMK